MNSWRDAWREVLRRPGRSALSLLSVVIAVATIVSVTAAGRTTRLAYQQVFQALGGRADLQVVARGGGRFDANAAEPLRKLAGVRAVVPLFHQATILYAGGKKAKVLGVGFTPDEPESQADFEIADGKLPAKLDEVALEAGLASGLGIKPGDKIKLLAYRGLQTRTVSGLARFTNAAGVQPGGMMLAPLSSLQTFFRAGHEVDALRVFLDKGVHAEDVIEHGQAVLPQELRIELPSARSGLAEETLNLIEVSLNLASALSFTTAVFIVLNVFLMNVGERRRQLSILRAIGATRRQVVSLVCREALVIAVAGTLLGIPAGVYGGRLLTASVGEALQISLPEAPVFSWPLVVGVALGPLLCLLAAWYPANKASQVSPLEGMRPRVSLTATKSSRVPTVAGLVGFALTVILAVASVQGLIPMWAAISTVILAMVSLMLLFPVALGPVTRLVERPLRVLLGFIGEIAQRLVVRNVERSSLTIGVLFIAVTAGVGATNAVFSVIDDIQAWYDRSITGDYLLRTMMPDMTGQGAVAMPETLGDEIRQLPGIERIDPIRFVRIDAAGNDAVLVTRDFSLYERPPLVVIAGDERKVLHALAAGEVVVGSVLAERLKLHVGDSLKITHGTTSHEFRVACIASEYTFGGSVVYLDRAAARPWFDLSGVDTYLLKVNSSPPPELAKGLQQLATRDGLLLQSFADLRKLIDATIDGVVGGLWLVLILGLLVGTLGVINTLSMNILEQTRELGMLRAIGMQPRQVVQIVLNQAVYLGLLGVISGGVLGGVLARLINLCLGSLLGHYVPWNLRPQVVAVLLVAALAIVILAALLPARRAAAMRPMLAMRQE